jgi:hypothetical protein
LRETVPTGPNETEAQGAKVAVYDGRTDRQSDGLTEMEGEGGEEGPRGRLLFKGGSIEWVGRQTD